MSGRIEQLLRNNQAFVAEQLASNPGYLERPSEGQHPETRFRRLVELNVIEQVNNLGKTHIIQDAWRAGRRPMIHGWVFDLASGFLRRHTGEINGNHAIHEVCKFHGASAGAPT